MRSGARKPNGIARRVERRALAASLYQGDHILVEETLVNSSNKCQYGKGKKAATVKHAVWQIRVDAIRKLNRGQKGLEVFFPNSHDAAG